MLLYSINTNITNEILCLTYDRFQVGKKWAEERQNHTNWYKLRQIKS